MTTTKIIMNIEVDGDGFAVAFSGPNDGAQWGNMSVRNDRAELHGFLSARVTPQRVRNVFRDLELSGRAHLELDASTSPD